MEIENISGCCQCRKGKNTLVVMFIDAQPEDTKKGVCLSCFSKLLSRTQKMEAEGVTEEDIFESMPPKPGEVG